MIELDWLKRWAMLRPEHPALICGESGRQYSYRQCYQASNQLALHLQRKHGISKGDRVALLAHNEIESVLLFFALGRLGAMLVPYNFRLTAPEISYLLENTEPKLFVVQDQFADVAEATGFGRAVSFERDLVPMLAEAGAGSRSDSGSGDQIEELAYQADWQSGCLILYTSGTTGKPKGVVLTHESLFFNSINTNLSLYFQPTDVFVNFLPLFHTGGWNVLLTPFLHHGATTVFLRKFEAEQVLQKSEEYGASLLFGVPTTMQMMADAANFDSVKLEKVRYAIVGGEAMPIPLIEKWQAKGVPIRQGYGLTEYGPNCFSLPAEDAIRKIGSIGKANFYIQTRVVNDEGNDVKAGETGELALRGPACMQGYWRNDKATAETIRDGWLYTGDLVRFDDEGYYYVVDRKKNMYISGGENVYPLEVEQVLVKHPEIKEAAVIGVADEKWGEVGKAFLVSDTRPSTDTVLQYCGKQLAKFKIPKYIEYIDALPKSDSAKVLKRKLQENQSPVLS